MLEFDDSERNSQLCQAESTGRSTTKDRLTMECQREYELQVLVKTLVQVDEFDRFSLQIFVRLLVLQIP